MKGRDTARHMIACRYIKENIQTIIQELCKKPVKEFGGEEILFHLKGSCGDHLYVGDVIAWFDYYGNPDYSTRAKITAIVSIDAIDPMGVMRDLNTASTYCGMELCPVLITNVQLGDVFVEHLQSMGVTLFYLDTSLAGQFESYLSSYTPTVDEGLIVNLP